jgi:hypothetical protein
LPTNTNLDLAISHLVAIEAIATRCAVDAA